MNRISLLKNENITNNKLVRKNNAFFLCYMGRKKKDNPKVPITLPVLKSTKDHIRKNNIKAGEILDNMFNQDK